MIPRSTPCTQRAQRPRRLTWRLGGSTAIGMTSELPGNLDLHRELTCPPDCRREIPPPRPMPNSRNYRRKSLSWKHSRRSSRGSLPNYRPNARSRSKETINWNHGPLNKRRKSTIWSKHWPSSASAPRTCSESCPASRGFARVHDAVVPDVASRTRGGEDTPHKAGCMRWPSRHTPYLVVNCGAPAPDSTGLADCESVTTRQSVRTLSRGSFRGFERREIRPL